jgi:hypothetical protein
VGVQFVQPTGYELTNSCERVVAIGGVHEVSPLKLFGASPNENRPVKRAINRYRLNKALPGYRKQEELFAAVI